MPVVGLNEFIRESEAARVTALELGRKGLADIAIWSYRTVIEASPVADPDRPGSGRLRASWTISINTPDERFAPLPPAGRRLPPPSDDNASAVAQRVQLGDVVWITNGSPCVSTVNDQTSFVDQVVAATQSKAEEIAKRLSARVVSGARALRAG